MTNVARLSNFGYLLMGKEATAGVPVVPTIALPLYEENISTEGNFQRINPAAGSKFAAYSTVPGQRTHKGDITCLFEMNTAAHLFNSLLTLGTPSNSGGVYTYPFTHGLDSGSYTWDISLGNIVKRLWGVKASSISINWDNNEGQAKVSVTALGSFDGREIASISGSGPYIVTLKDPNGVFDGTPTKGLIVGDLIRFFDVSAAANVADGTVTAITSTTVTVTISTGSTSVVVAGDGFQLRPATPTYNNLQPILWSKTRYYFGDTAAAALALAITAHTPLETGSDWELMHNFADDDGAKRSGSFDPYILNRTFADATFQVKKLTDTMEDLIAFKNMNKSACVIRHFCGPNNEYELRVTLNALITSKPLGNIKSGEMIYSTMELLVNQSQTDGQAFDVKVLAAITSL